MFFYVDDGALIQVISVLEGYSYSNSFVTLIGSSVIPTILCL